jgi:hypothetical protein
MLTSILVLVIILAACCVGISAFLAGIRRIPSGSVGIVHRKYGTHHPDDRFTVRVHGLGTGKNTAARSPPTYSVNASKSEPTRRGLSSPSFALRPACIHQLEPLSMPLRPDLSG